MNEGQMYKAINSRLPKEVHHQGMTGASMANNGTPDRYYDGPKRDLWVEYKVFDSMPRNGVVCCAPVECVKKQPRGHLTPLQYRWLKRRWSYGGNAVVIAGLPNRTAVIQVEPQAWIHGTPVSTAMSLVEVASWISSFVGSQKTK